MLAKLCVRTQTMAAQETVNPAANEIVKKFMCVRETQLL